MKINKFKHSILTKSNVIIKILIILYIVTLLLLSTASAKEFCLYNISGMKTDNIKTIIIPKFANNSGINLTNDTNNKNIYYHTDFYGKNNIYIRLYENHLGTQLFAVTDNQKLIKNIEICLSNAGINNNILENKDYFSEYKYDFISYIRKNKNIRLNVIPDKLKFIKDRSEKTGLKIFKETNVYATNYTQDSKEINLTLLDKTILENNEIQVIRRKYRLKHKENRNIHAYEYIFVNKGKHDITILDVNSGQNINKNRIILSSLSDLDKYDLTGAIGSALMPFTLGISSVLKIPSGIKNYQAAKEISRFTLNYPKNYVILPSGFCRILTVNDRINPVPLAFKLLINYQEYNILF